MDDKNYGRVAKGLKSANKRIDTVEAHPAQPKEPTPPADLKQTIATGAHEVNQVTNSISTVANKLSSVASAAQNPAEAAAAALGDAVDAKASKLVSGLAKSLGPYPAATLTGMALGIPHAHIKHPPSGPPPLPPIPFPPMGPVMVGTNVTVLINGKPTARCGDYGFNPSCCGVVPPLSAMFQIITGSSNVYIGGSRAARSGIDITQHCFSIPSPKIPVKLGKLAGVAAKVGKVADKVSKVAGKVSGVVSKVSVAVQAAQIASSFVEAEAEDDAAMAAAIGLSVAMMAAQAAADAAAAALTKTIGTDQPFVPPIGTPGQIMVGSPNVMLGGFPLPSFSAIAKGLLKRAKGLKAGGESGGGAPEGCQECRRIEE
jgi:uncharacterized Zn-binding protein involved in type VI secretion/conjugal transfer/entry exclusion protein